MSTNYRKALATRLMNKVAQMLISICVPHGKQSLENCKTRFAVRIHPQDNICA
jgi:hypothetical protein